MDFSEFRSGDWLMIAGGATMLVFGFALDWASLAPATKNNAFDYFWTGGVAWLLVVGSGLVAFVLGALKHAPGRWSLVLLLTTGVATALMLLRLILGAGKEAGFQLDRSSGMYIAFLAAAVAFAGALSNIREEHQPIDDDADMSGTF